MALQRIKLGNPPKSFSRTVEFAFIDGTKGSIDVEFHYRTREEFAKFIADVYKPRSEKGTPETALEDAAAAELDRDAALIHGALVSWDLEDGLSFDSARQLASTFPAAATAIQEAYRLAIVEGRRKN
jgi:hypothetical protein